MVKHANLWFESCPTRREVSTGLIKSVDTLIIGGGLAGVSLLYYLVNAGLINTYLVEESSIGFHASGRGTGQLMFRGQKLFHEMEDGESYLTFVGENNRRFLNGLRSLSFDSDLRECGGLRLASTEEEMDRLEKESTFINSVRKIRCPILSRKELEAIISCKGFVGGMFVPNEATYNPYKVVNGLREVIEKSGARVFTNTHVESVLTNDDGSITVSIRNRGTIKTKRVVYCTGAYTGRLLPEFAATLTPFREQIVATDYLEKDILEAIPSMSISSDNGNNRIRLYNSRLIASGMRRSVRGQQEGIVYDGEVSSAVHDKIRTFATDAFPYLKTTKLTHMWSSVFCSTPDGKPLIGAVPGKPNQYMLTGFGCYDSSNAILGSMVIKDLIRSDSIASVVSGSEILSPGRFTNV